MVPRRDSSRSSLSRRTSSISWVLLRLMDTKTSVLLHDYRLFLALDAMNRIAKTDFMITTWYAASPARDWTTLPVSGRARRFHESLPGYNLTPLTSLPQIAAELGAGQVLVKDESARLGLAAFKVLGASWACHQVLKRRPGAHLVAATDGNHGRAVARMSARFGVGGTVFVPKVMRAETAALIENEGAEVVRTDGDYDHAVRAAAAHA